MDLSNALMAKPFPSILERAFSHLPDRQRHRLARRRNPDFRYAQFFQVAKPNEDYELTSAMRLNCIFIHIPKAAGVSVAKAVFGSRSGGHLPAAYYLWLLGGHRFDAAFKFTFVRNPKSRVLSAYYFLKNGGMNDNDRSWAERHVIPFQNFDNFVNRSLPKPDVINSLHFRPQMSYLIDPRTGRNAADFVGRFESINDDFRKLRRYIGLTNELPYENRRPSGPSESVSPSSELIIQSLYKKDYDFLGF